MSAARPDCPCPPVTFQEERSQIMRGQTLYQRLVVVAGVPTLAVEADSRMEVLGNRIGGYPTDTLQCPAADNRRRTAPEGPVVSILARHDHLEEHALVVSACLEVLKGIVVSEVVRRLDQRHRGIIEVADNCVQDVRLWHVIGIEDQK